jgi:hypothetical protein
MFFIVRLSYLELGKGRAHPYSSTELYLTKQNGWMERMDGWGECARARGRWEEEEGRGGVRAHTRAREGRPAERNNPQIATISPRAAWPT